ncbi:hypothetical protein SSPNP10_15675 [Streptomyces sp. NP10]|uniref:hypothetical protein n=1 Tax=Streptomyces sp. NP10 TaxID=1141731 RepID=UPI001002ECF7|nr:hypothetical protein [Streptomyces sp. NP10]RUP66700.1 hypothetical protein SSPNP10_15675 [Streptomyces sp. NP10]
MADIDIPEDLIKLERAAWAEQQAGALTLETADAASAKVSRLALEMATKRAVRHPEG